MFLQFAWLVCSWLWHSAFIQLFNRVFLSQYLHVYAQTFLVFIHVIPVHHQGVCTLGGICWSSVCHLYNSWRKTFGCHMRYIIKTSNNDILVMLKYDIFLFSGAGISVTAGIPDFRSRQPVPGLPHMPHRKLKEMFDSTHLSVRVIPACFSTANYISWA